ncbi:TPA: DUF551 domain-containing protein [Enterobacter ludwigii]|nr:DUF551 domain-containing protein [Enterobacter ludwigii]
MDVFSTLQANGGGSITMKPEDWINVDFQLPENQEGKWSKDVIALSDSGDLFRLACMGGYWQRTQAFIDSGSTKITHWMPLIYPDD